MKRFTDSDLFRDPWFRALSPDAKMLWMFLCHECDNSGVWERDEGLFMFLSGVSSEFVNLLEELGDRILLISDDKILVPKFVLFQNRSNLSNDCPPHRHTLRLLEKHGLEQDDSGTIIQLKGLAKGNGRVTKGLAKGNDTLSKGLANPLGIGTGKGKGKGNIKEKGGMGEKTIPEALDDPAFHEAWEAYLEHRRQTRWATHKKNTLANMFEDFETWGLDETIKALNESIRQGWRGVFPPKSDKPNRMEPDRDYENGLKIKK